MSDHDSYSDSDFFFLKSAPDCGNDTTLLLDSRFNEQKHRIKMQKSV